MSNHLVAEFLLCPGILWALSSNYEALIHGTHCGGQIKNQVSVPGCYFSYLLGDGKYGPIYLGLSFFPCPNRFISFIEETLIYTKSPTSSWISFLLLSALALLSALSYPKTFPYYLYFFLWSAGSN